MWAALPLGAAFNAVLELVAPQGEFMPFVVTGLYAGEFLTLATWFSWGPGSHAVRFCAVAVTGFAWTLATCAGWLVPQKRANLSGDEMHQMLIVVPLAFAVCALLMGVARAFWWGFRSPYMKSPPSFPLAFWFLAAVSPAAWFRLSAGSIRGHDLYWSGLVGVSLGAVAILTTPWLSLGFLGKYLRPWWFLPALILAPLPGLVLAWWFPIPGGGGCAVFLYDGALVASLTALLVMLIAFALWRWIGVRIIYEVTVEALELRE